MIASLLLNVSVKKFEYRSIFDT